MNAAPSAARCARVATASLVALVCLAGVAVTSDARAEAPPRIDVVVSERGAAPYEEALDGLRRGLAARGVEARLEVQYLEEGRPRLEGPPTLVLALGGRATRAVIEAAPNAPLVAGLVEDAGELAGATDATAVILEHPLEVRLRTITRAVPDCFRVGLVYDASRGAFVEDARAAARRFGVILEARPVRSAPEIPAALASLSNSACAVLGVADPLVLTRQTAKAFLLFSFRNRIPLFGPTEAWVEAGALASLAWRYDELGDQVAALTQRALAGVRPGEMPVEPPRSAPLALNRKTARHMKIKLPAEVRREVERVH